MRQKLKSAGAEGPGYTTNKEKREQIKSDFYMFQKRLAMKSELETLREGFEKDRKRLAKALAKKQTEQERVMRKM